MNRHSSRQDRNAGRVKDHAPTVWVVAALAALLLAARGDAALASPPAAEGQEAPRAELAAVFEKLRLTLDRTKSVQYKATVERRQHINIVENPKLLHQKPYALSYQLEYTAQGNLFRSHVRFRGLDGKDNESEVAFNGEKYQRLRNDSGVLELTKNMRSDQPTQSLMVQPLAFPFLFALGEGDPADFSTLLNEGLWDRLVPVARLEGEQSVQGKPCAVLVVNRRRHQHSAGDTLLTVFLDKSQDFYPIRIMSEVKSSREPIPRHVVDVETRQVETDRGAVIVPVLITSKSTRTDGTLVMDEVYRIEFDSLAVNKPVDRALFTIDKARAWNGVFDQDKNILDRTGSAAVAVQGGVRVWIIALNIAALSAAVAVFMVLRRRRAYGAG
jgi:hypothetical protein